MKKQISSAVGILLLSVIAGGVASTTFILSNIEEGVFIEKIQKIDYKQDEKIEDVIAVDVLDCNQNFNIIYSFGVGTSTLNTKKNTYSPDMCGKPSVVHEMILSDEEKDKICTAIKDNDLMEIKNDFVENCDAAREMCLTVTPLSKIYLEIFTEDRVVKKISYLSHYYNQEDPQLEKFISVTDIIDGLISAKVRELNIEQPMCGYM